MSRWIWFLGCGVLGLVLLICGVLVPAHLRAVDLSIIEQAGRNTPALVDQGLALVREKQIGTAELLVQGARTARVAGYGTLHDAVMTAKAQDPALEFWGGPAPRFAGLIDTSAAVSNGLFTPLTELVIRAENRERILEHLRGSPSAAVQEILRFRSATNTVLFPPSASPSGQALDAALGICGLLIEEGRLTATLGNALVTAAAGANHGNSDAFEQALMDLISLGQRFNWGQLALFVGQTVDLETLHLQAGFSRKAGEQLPVLVAAVQVSGRPGAVMRYLKNFSQTGLPDIGTALRNGSGALEELLARGQQLYVAPYPGHLFVRVCLNWPAFGLGVKWFLYLAGGFFLAAALHYGRPAVSPLERPLQVRGFHVAREFLFALGFVLFVLLLSEPFLAQGSQKWELPLRLRLPTLGNAVAAARTGVKSSIMNPGNQLTMLLFFVVQGLLYISCVVKLAEIRRQRVPPRIKLKLLENEDHLFDAGLYLGFLGTIVSFVLYSLVHAQQFSLMVAYSSTSFGIIFVSAFKIFNLRPARRKLLLEAEAENLAPAAPHPTQPLTAPL